MSIWSLFQDIADSSTKKIALISIFGGIILPLGTGYVTANQIIIFMIFATGFNFLLGYTGELSFGHAMFFGTGAYGTMASMYVLPNFYVSIIVGTLFSGVLGVVVGAIIRKSRGIAFAMITLAIAHLIYIFVATKGNLTGGNNGLFMPDLSRSFDPINISGGGVSLYLLCLFLLGFVLLIQWKILHSPFGKMMLMFRENEERAIAMGIYTDKIFFKAFLISATISGLAGSLYTILFQLVTPTVLHWQTTGEVIVQVLIGGVGTVVGPVLGALVYIFLTETLKPFFSPPGFFIGLIVILLVLFAPNGLWGSMKDFAQRYIDG